jgi:hypothetical protein
VSDKHAMFRLVHHHGVAPAGELVVAHDDAIRRRDEHGAPQVTVEALFWAFREGGLAAFDQPANCERLSRLSPEQLVELRRRIKGIVT